MQASGASQCQLHSKLEADCERARANGEMRCPLAHLHTGPVWPGSGAPSKNHEISPAARTFASSCSRSALPTRSSTVSGETVSGSCAMRCEGKQREAELYITADS